MVRLGLLQVFEQALGDGDCVVVRRIRQPGVLELAQRLGGSVGSGEVAAAVGDGRLHQRQGALVLGQLFDGLGVGLLVRGDVLDQGAVSKTMLQHHAAAWTGEGLRLPGRSAGLGAGFLDLLLPRLQFRLVAIQLVLDAGVVASALPQV